MRKLLPNHGISLIEILVVGAILAVLFALIVPIYQKVQDSTNKVVCQTNLRQMMEGALRFIFDNNGKLPYYQFDASSTGANPGIRDYVGLPANQNTGVKEYTVFTCPSLQEGLRPSGNRFNRNYSVNGHTFNEEGKELDDRIGANVGYMYLIKHPERTAFYMDGRASSVMAEHPGRYNYGYYVRISQWRNGLNFLQFPHGERQNVVFLDGHVESLLLEDAPGGTGNYKDVFWSGGAFE